jgi:membrane protein DedA with SNARE-associated domain
VDWFSPENLTHLIATYGYLAIAVIIGLESMGLPLPGESALVIAGFTQVAMTTTSPWWWPRPRPAPFSATI